MGDAEELATNSIWCHPESRCPVKFAAGRTNRVAKGGFGAVYDGVGRMGDFAKRKRREGDGLRGEVGHVGADYASKPIGVG